MIYASTPRTGSALHRGPGVYLAAGTGFGRAHSPNPILLQYRRAPGRTIYWRDMVTEPSAEEKDHAHRVLSKLARVRALAEVNA